MQGYFHCQTSGILFSDDLLRLFGQQVGVINELPNALYGIAIGHEAPQRLETDHIGACGKA